MTGRLSAKSRCQSVGGSLTGAGMTYSSASKSRCFERQSAFRFREAETTGRAKTAQTNSPRFLLR